MQNEYAKFNLSVQKGGFVNKQYSLNSSYGSYYYLRNAQNDIVKLIDSSGSTVVEYCYDSWGKPLSTSGSLASTLGKDNPFRYRGYVYDEETGFYYLQSRYYNPEVGRFISADVLLSTGQGVLGHNAYAYCLNDPINSVDGNGNFSFKSLFSGAKLVSIGVTAIAAAATILTCGAAAPIMVAVATATAVAGTATVVNGMAEIGEGLTASSDTSNDGTNFVRDFVMGGNADAYEKQKRIFSAAAQVGTAICGAYTAAKGGNVCFVAGTQVETADGSTAIENIKEGDRVFAANPETGEVAYKKVVQTFVNETDELVEVTVNGETIKSTPSHPFYVPQKGWTSAISLRAGDILVLSNGEYVIVEQIQHELLESPIKVYNFEVEDFHTYYVSANADSDEFVLVHNSCNHNSRWNSERRNYWKRQAASYANGPTNEMSPSGLYRVTKNNLNRMLRGCAPIGTDDKSVVLHHIYGIVNDFYEYTEMLATTHTGSFRMLHPFLFNK